MARRKKDNGEWILFVIIAVVLIIIALLTPLVLLFVYMSNSLGSDEIKKELNGNESDFWLDENEKKEFIEKFERLDEATSNIRNAKNTANEANISINKDGSFSSRSKIGKEVNSILNKYEPLERRLSSELYDLQELPLTRWEEFNGMLKKAKSSMLSFYSWAAVLVYFAITLSKESLWSVFIPYWALATNFFRDKKIPLEDGDLKMVAVATVTAIASYFLVYFVMDSPAAKHTPAPEKVTLSNINDY